MKNLFKKYLSVLLAVMIILTASPLSIISFAWDPNVDDGFNLSLKTKIFHQVDGEWVEAETVEPGESVKARVYIGTDYYAGPGQVVVFYSNSFFEDEYASNASIELAVNTDPESSTKKHKIDGFFNKGKGIIYALLDGGYITEEFAQTHTALTFFYMFEGTSPTCQMLSDEHWFAEFDLKVKEDATGTGSFVILEETVTDPYEHQDAYISITKGQQGSHPDNAANMYLWSANVTVENTPVSLPVTYSDYTVETYTMDVNGEYEMTSETIEAETGSVVEAAYIIDEGFELNAENSVLSGTVAADGSLVLKVYIDRKKYIAVFESENEEFDLFEVAFNSEIPFPQSTPQKKNHTFLGWSFDGVTILESLGVMDTEGKTFYAVWEAKEPLVATDKEYGIKIEYSPDDYSGEVGVVADKPSDKNTENLINNKIGSGNSTVYDIGITVEGAEAQPQGTVTVNLPLPEGYNASNACVYEINAGNGTVEKIDAEYKDGYFIFEATTLGSYVIFEEYDGVLKICKPSITTIKYGDAIILHADLSEPLPEGAYIKWTADNGNFSYTASKDGSTCQITPSKTGNTTFTATVYDSSGNEIQSDTQTMTSKAGFFQKIGAFFRKLFKLTKVYPELFRYMA